MHAFRGAVISGAGLGSPVMGCGRAIGFRDARRVALVTERLARIGTDLQLVGTIVERGDGQKGSCEVRLLAAVVERKRFPDGKAGKGNALRRFLRRRSRTMDPMARLTRNGRFVR